MTNAYQPPASPGDLAPAADPKPPVRPEVRVVAAFLAAGGLWGILTVLWQSTAVGSGAGANVTVRVPLLGFLVLLLFAVTLTAGVLLWSGRRAAVLFATVLLAAQTLVVRVAGFDYHFYTGFAGLVGFGNGNLQVTGSLGSSFGFWVGGPENRPVVLMFNLAAVVGLYCLGRSLIGDAKAPK